MVTDQNKHALTPYADTHTHLINPSSEIIIMLQWHHYPDQIAPTNTRGCDASVCAPNGHLQLMFSSVAAPKGNGGSQDVAAANNVLPFLMLMMDKALLSKSQNAEDIDEIAGTASEERKS